ncbi:ras-related protein Rab-10-like [Halichondria panicea]|uniref:ras-related protein Rab-10-like n=1 Tax=Halichondria panicea TaxID=6063 RepID=UPI00312BAEFC
MTAETFDALMKIVIIGDSAVGKTCLILRYTQDVFRPNFLSTIGVDFKTKTVEHDKRKFKLQIWDTAGQERYNTIRKNFYRGAKGVVVVYDTTSPDSFASLTRWMEDISQNIGDGTERPAILILGNKIDKEDERRVPMLSGKQAAEEFGTSFSEVSALAGIGVDEAFDELVKSMALLIDQDTHRQEYGRTLRVGSDVYDGHRQSKCSC